MASSTIHFAHDAKTKITSGVHTISGFQSQSLSIAKCQLGNANTHRQRNYEASSWFY